MGSGAWSTHVYATASAARAATGTSAFEYSDLGNREVHKRLDPRGVVRESRDSDEHPQSLAIAVEFDVTGSMQLVPRKMQEKLPELFSLLVDKGYARDPQIMFGAIGDATCDRVPLQVGQFESNNAVEEDLGAIVLEGGGGGQKTESYELALYFMARRTSIDCYEKRGRRGYLFIIGDEMPYPSVSTAQVRKWVGDDLAETLTVEQIVEEVKAKYHVYFILPTGTLHAGDKEVLATWRGLLGQNVVELDDLEAVCETIALTIGLSEGNVDLNTGLGHLRDVGSDAGAVVGKALATVGAGSLVASGPTLVSGPDGDGADRL